MLPRGLYGCMTLARGNPTHLSARAHDVGCRRYSDKRDLASFTRDYQEIHESGVPSSRDCGNGCPASPRRRTSMRISALQSWHYAARDGENRIAVRRRQVVAPFM